MDPVFAWTVYGTMTALLIAVISLLGAALLGLRASFDARFDKVDARFDQVDARFDRVEARMRDDKAELLDRMDVQAERITRLEGP